MIKQLRVRLHNEPGALANMVSALAEASVDMKALDVSDRAGEFGEACLIASNLETAVSALVASGHEVEVESAICVEVDDRVGGLLPVLRAVAGESINVKQLYAFVSRVAGKSLAVLLTDDPEKTQDLLERKGFQLLSVKALEAEAERPDPLGDHLGVGFLW